MKRIIYSQRVELKESYHERWDCADQKIAKFLMACGYLPIPVPNILELADRYIEELQPAGIFLTGGNSLVKYGGNAPERDRTDAILLERALEKNIPVYAICRGMQSILDYFEIKLEKIDGHVGVKHRISGEINGEVNSYHSQAALSVGPPLKILSQTLDGVIEAVAYPEKHIIATMWHPERELPFNEEDKLRVRELYG